MSIWVTGSLEVRNTSGDLVFQVGDSAVANPDPTPMNFRSSIVEGSFEVIGDQNVSHKILTASYAGGTNGARVGVGVSAETNVAFAVGGDLGLSDTSSDRRIVVESASALGDAYINAGYDNSNRLFIMWEGQEKRIRMGTRESGSTYFSSFIIKSGSADLQNTFTAGGDIKAGGSLQVGGNVIQASDGGNTIIMDTDDNVTIRGDLTVNGGDILGPTAGQLAIKSDGNAIIQVDADSSGGTPVFAVWDESQNPQFRVQLNAADGGTNSVTTTYGHAHVQENLNVTGSFEMGSNAVANFGAGSTLNFGANSSIDCAAFTIDSTSNITLDSNVGQVYIKRAGDDRFSFTDGNLKIHNENSTLDYFAIDVGSNGVTTLTTNDDGAAAAGHLHVNPDGMIQLQPIGGVRIVGTNPYLRIGDGGAEDVKLEFYYQYPGDLYYHVGVDNTDSIFKIGYGNVVGTDSAIEVDTTTSVNVNLPMTVNDTITLENGATIGNGTSGVIDLNVGSTRLSGDLEVNGGNIIVDRSSTASTEADIRLRTFDTSIVAGDNVGSVRFYGTENNSDYSEMAVILVEADEDFTHGTNFGSRMKFGTATNAGTLSTKMELDNAGNLIVGGGLDVDGGSLTYTTNRLAMEGGGIPSVVLMSDSPTSANAAGLYIKKYVPSPTTPAAGFNVGELYFQASTDDVTYHSVASIITEFSETFQPTAAEGTRIVFNATPNGATGASQHLQVGGMDNAQVAVGSHPLTNGGGNAGLLIGVGSGNDARLDLIENTGGSEGFGTAFSYGFRVMYEGTANELKIQSGEQTTVVDRIIVDRTTGLLQVPSVYTLSTASSANVNVDVAGQIRRSTSDRRVKKDISDLSASLDQVTSLLPRLFYDISDDTNSVHIPGFVADEVVDIFPELVPERNEPVEITRSVSYDRVTAYIVSALKEVKDRLEALENSN
jgi:hypothetical protein